MRGAYAAFSLVRMLRRAATFAALALFLGLYYAMRYRVLPWLVIGALSLWLLLRIAARQRPRASARALPDPRETDRKRELLDTRLRTAEARLAILAPDVAQAARDLAAGRISRADYETALDVAAREVYERRTVRHSRVRFH